MNIALRGAPIVALTASFMIGGCSQSGADNGSGGIGGASVAAGGTGEGRAGSNGTIATGGRAGADATTGTGGSTSTGGVSGAAGGGGRGGAVPNGGASGIAGGGGRAGAVTPAEKSRIVVLTDISNGPDDEESLVRFLVYSNELDVEGLIATTSTYLRTAPRTDLILRDIDAYALVRPNPAAPHQG